MGIVGLPLPSGALGALPNSLHFAGAALKSGFRIAEEKDFPLGAEFPVRPKRRIPLKRWGQWQAAG